MSGRTIWRQSMKTAPAIPLRSSERSGLFGRTTGQSPCDCPVTTGRRAGIRRTMRRRCFAAMFKAAGADLIDCSSGQVSKAERPVYGRLFRRRFWPRSATRRRSPRSAVGAISEADHANSILAAGRADLCAIARPHLADPAWTLHEAARIGVKTIAWPKQYATAKGQYEANLARAAAAGAEAK